MSNGSMQIGETSNGEMVICDRKDMTTIDLYSFMLNFVILYILPNNYHHPGYAIFNICS